MDPATKLYDLSLDATGKPKGEAILGSELGPDGRAQPLPGLDGSDAVSLFCERAQQTKPDFRLPMRIHRLAIERKTPFPIAWRRERRFEKSE